MSYEERGPMPQLITSEQFVIGLLSALRKRGEFQIKLTDNLEDARFEKAYNLLLERSRNLNVRPDFSLITNSYHGDSEVLRETLYAVREQGIVAINNPSFKTVEIKLDLDEAAFYLKATPVPSEFFEEAVRAFFPERGDESGASNRSGSKAA